MTGQLIVTQFLEGKWEELIRLDAESDINEDQIKQSLVEMKDFIFNNDKVNISNETSVVIFNREDGPIKISFM